MRSEFATLLKALRLENQLDVPDMSDIEVPGAPSATANPFPWLGGTYGVAFIAAAGLALLSALAARTAEPVGLLILAAFASLGIFFVLAALTGPIRIGDVSTTTDLLARVVEASPHGVQICDPAGVAIFSNDAFRAIVGHDALGETRTLEGVLSDRPELAQPLFRLARAGERGEPHVEDVAVTLAGQSRQLRVSVEPLPVTPHLGASRSLVLWRTTDITDAHGRESDTLADIQRQLEIYEDLPVGLAVAGSDGLITHLNDRLAAWLGYGSKPGILGLADILTEGNAALVLGLLNNAQPGAHRIDLDLVREDGRLWPSSLIVTARAGRLVIGVMERVEEGQAAFKSMEARLSRFFQSAPFGIALVGADGRVQQSNAAFGRLLLDPAAGRATNVVDLLGADDKDTRALADLALTAAFSGKANIAPFDIGVGKGREFARRVYVTSLARSASGREPAVVYVIDVTEQKALEVKFAQSQKMEAVGTLAGGIAHDFNNVLTAIIGFSDLLLQAHKPGDPAYTHIMSIKTSANRAAGMVRQLLAFSRRQTMLPQVLQLGEVLTDVSVLLNRLLGERIELKVNTGRDLWHVKADRTQLEQVLMNLAVNAKDAMPHGGRLTIRARNISERDSIRLENVGMVRGEYVLVEVEDTGVGIGPEVMGKIFEPFFTTKAVGKGTGLGLATVYGIVKQTGGFIYPDSTVGKGTTFRVYLPRHHVDAEEEALAMQATRKEPQRDLTGVGRVLLVEDEDAVRTFAVEALRRQGYEVLQACDGVEAMEIMTGCDFNVDLVVSDVIMPEMDGPTLLKEVRQHRPDMKFVFVSGYPDDAFKNNIDAGADFAFLPKPYSLAQIASKVKEELGR